MIDKDLVIEKISEEVILNILSQHNITPYQIKNNEIWFKTFCHGGDSHKLCFYRDSKTFYCYTNCGQMSLFTAIMKLLNCSFKEALLLLSENVGVKTRYGFKQKIETYNEDNTKLSVYASLRQKHLLNEKTLPVISDRVLNYFEPNVYYEGWLNEGIKPEVMREFNIRWYELREWIIIPHVNSDGQLVGIRRRTLVLEEIVAKTKYMPLILESVTYSHSLGMNLYGLYQHKEAIIRNRRIVIFEAEKSVMLSHGYYGKEDCSVAVCGFNITMWQFNTIIKLGIGEVVLGFDKDFNELDYSSCDEESENYKEYKRYVNKLLSMAYMFVPYCKTYILWDNDNLLEIKDAPVDKGKNTYEILYKNKIEITSEDKK